MQVRRGSVCYYGNLRGNAYEVRVLIGVRIEEEETSWTCGPSLCGMLDLIQ